MNITLNGTSYEIEDAITVLALLTQLDVPHEGTAVAVNEKIVPRQQHADHAITDGDRVEVMRAIGGG